MVYRRPMIDILTDIGCTQTLVYQKLISPEAAIVGEVITHCAYGDEVSHSFVNVI